MKDLTCSLKTWVHGKILIMEIVSKFSKLTRSDVNAANLVKKFDLWKKEMIIALKVRIWSND